MEQKIDLIDKTFMKHYQHTSLSVKKALAKTIQELGTDGEILTGDNFWRRISKTLRSRRGVKKFSELKKK